MNKLSNSKLLITGGAGFIGSNLVEYFLDNNNEVVCLDNISTGHKKNIAPFFGDKNFQFINGDIQDIDMCKKATQGCDYVFHQAALGSVPRSIKDPATTNAVNIDGFLNMLIAAKEEDVARVVSADLLNYKESWADIKDMLLDCMSAEFRSELLGDDGRGWVYSWHCMDHAGYRDNPRRKDVGFGNIYRFYRGVINETNSTQDE